jgi:hypothetical protein
MCLGCGGGGEVETYRKQGKLLGKGWNTPYFPNLGALSLWRSGNIDPFSLVVNTP